jgi:hypothetical protein
VAYTCGYLGVTSPLLSGRLRPEPRVQRKSGLATPYPAKISAKGRTQNTPTVTAFSPVLPYAPNFLELRYSEVHMAPSARSGGAYYVLWMFSVSYVRQLPCVSILNLRNAQSQVISPTTYGPPHAINKARPEA